MRARRPAALALVTAALLLALPTTGSSADTVTPRQVQDLQRTVDQTAAQLTAATSRLATGQAELARMRGRLAGARRDADTSTAQAAEARARLQGVLAAAYRSPLPDSLMLALSGDPDRFRQAIIARADLTRVRGSQQELLRQATAGRVRARDDVRTVEQLSAEVDLRDADLRAQLAAVRSSADDAGRRLAEASARLRAQSSLATCSGGPTPGANGFLPPSALCPLDDAPGAALRADAAAAFNRLTETAVAERGGPLCVTDSYRSYAGQLSVFRRKPALAAVPGTSRHGLGLAVDLGCGVERFGSQAHRWMQANAGRFGWFHPAWAEPGGSRPEPWHWEFRG